MRRRRILLAVIAAVAALTAACGSGGGTERVEADAPDGKSAPRGAVAASAVETQAVDTMRFEMGMSMTVGASAPVDTGAFASGRLDGTTVAARTDLGAFVDAVTQLDAGTVEGLRMDGFGGLAGEDLDLEVVTDGTVQFFRGGFFAALPDLDPTVAPALGELAAVQDRWGYVDLTGLTGLTPADLTSLTGVTSFPAPRDLLSTLEATGTDVTEVGSADVRGVPTTRYSAAVSLVSLGAMAGQDPDAIAESFDTEGMPDATVDALLEEMLAVFEDWTIPVDVWIDTDGLMRRIEIRISTAEITAAIGEAFDAPEGPTDQPELSMTIWMEVFDFDDPSIEVTLPDRDTAVDLTDTFALLTPR